ncbi:monofunctional biosynthetic peptidoglycan transglycosylase [Parasediminibacterium sp. JCM 36343]|uniref:monofunctional biosynthetic peptidoglycan transglycosylase n=1 Tax=Parasediminibacterium sp. JCM 36343 TaxID=3374279 RepID=UPI003978FDB0
MGSKRSPVKKTSFLWRLWRFTKRAVLFMFISSLLYVIMCRWVMPPITITQLSNGIVYGLKRDYVTHAEISPNARLAAIASEDQRFPDHFGIDIEAIEKSMKPRKGKKKNRPAGAGASTITQQTAKNVFLWQGEGVWKYIRKVPEVYFTLLIELIWGKQRILDVYLNVIETGQGIFGIEAASEAYFGKPAKNLTRQEAAMIIACLPNPKKFTVRPASTRVSWRYPQILREMHNIEDDEDLQKLVH